MRSKSKKSTRVEKKADSFRMQFNHEIKGVFTIGLGLLLMVSVHGWGAGAVGDWIRNLLMGLFANGALILPYLIVLLGILTLFNHSIWQERRSLFFFAVVFLGILIYMTLWDLNFIEALTELTFGERTKAAYLWGIEGVSGGLVGIGITSLLVSLFGRTGAYIIVSCMMVLATMIYTDLSLLKLLKGIRSLLARFFRLSKQTVGEFVYQDTKEEAVVEGKGKKNKQAKTEHMLQQMELFDANLEQKEVKEKEPAELEHEIKIVDYLPEEKPAPSPVSEVKKGIAQGELQADQAEEAGDELPLITGTYEAVTPLPYEKPGFDLLNELTQPANKEDKKRIIKKAKILEETLHNFGVEAKVIKVSKGPVITRYELQPSVGVKVSKIVNLNDDIALNMAAPAIRIEAPIPGKAAIGIEIPNEDVSMVTLREVLDSASFIQGTARVPFALGKDISGMPVVTDITRMPHLLIAGATGSGKSVCINTLLLSVLYSARPEEVKLILIDPKVVELNQYNGLPHLLIPVVTDPKKATNALNWAVHEMTKRYQLFAENGVKDIGTYNEKLPEAKLPFIVIVIDELADLMMVAANDVEDAICRLAQMARAAGLHLILATQRPSVDIITGVIKANIPSRIAFSVASQTDSRTILDMGGAEKLLGKGDMLFYPMGANKPVRVQGAFVSEKEVDRVVAFIKGQTEQIQYHADLADKLENGEGLDLSTGSDELFRQAVDLVIEGQQASISMLQRRMRIGYNRAARLIDEMEAKGIIGPHEGSKPRQVLLSASEWEASAQQS